MLCVIITNPARGATFVVDSTIDLQDAEPGNGNCAAWEEVCTLRAAIQEANALGGSHVITLPPGTYRLMISGRGELEARSGDLNVVANITINGAVSATTIIDGAGLDRVFHVRNRGTLTLNDITVQHGHAGSGPMDSGGGLYADAGTELTLLR